MVNLILSLLMEKIEFFKVFFVCSLLSQSKTQMMSQNVCSSCCLGTCYVDQACLCLMNAGIKGMCQYTRLF